MIVYDLKCKNDHRFEGWFRDSATYDAQRKARKVDCPLCGSTKIEKAPMAPRLGKSKGEMEHAEKRANELARKILEDVKELRKQVEENCDYVGEKFAEEARRIHYGETESRGIYGEATEEESKALEEEDIKFQRVPWTSKRNKRKEN
jgi:hypothetical protein